MSRVPAVRALLWDMDGVIVNSGAFHYEAYRTLLAERGVELDRTRYFTTLFGRRNWDILRAVLGDLPDPEIRALAEEKERRFRRFVAGKIAPLPGAVPLMERARTAGLRQAVVSSTPCENIELVLTSLGVKALLDAIVGEEDVERGKPDPQGFTHAADTVGIPYAECVVLEDAPEGIQAGKSGGMRCIGVATTRPAERLTAAGADVVVETLEDPAVAAFVFGQG